MDEKKKKKKQKYIDIQKELITFPNTEENDDILEYLPDVEKEKKSFAKGGLIRGVGKAIRGIRPTKRY